MATHSSILAWRIPGMGEPGGLPSMGSHRVRHDGSDLAVAAVPYCWLWFYGLQHARLPCPWLSPRVCSKSCPLSQWCYLMILFSAAAFLASKSFSMSWLLISGGQNISASASVSVLPRNIQGWFLLGLTGLISLRSKELKSLLQHHSMKSPILLLSIFFMVQLSHLYMTTGKATALTTWTFVGKVTSLLFNTLSRFVTAFLPRSKSVLISWLQSLSTVEIVSLFLQYQ